MPTGLVVKPRFGFPSERRGYRIINKRNGMVVAEYAGYEQALLGIVGRPRNLVVTDCAGKMLFPEG